MRSGVYYFLIAIRSCTLFRMEPKMIFAFVANSLAIFYPVSWKRVLKKFMMLSFGGSSLLRCLLRGEAG